MIFVLGFFIEWIEISYIAVPLFLPIFINANVDLVWLATLICVNLQTSFLTPPFGWSLFFLRGVAPPEITTNDIYRGIVPFVVHADDRAGDVLRVFPRLRLWLPTDDRLVIAFVAGMLAAAISSASHRAAGISGMAWSPPVLAPMLSMAKSTSTLPALANSSVALK